MPHFDVFPPDQQLALKPRPQLHDIHSASPALPSCLSTLFQNPSFLPYPNPFPPTQHKSLDRPAEALLSRMLTQRRCIRRFT